MYCKSCEKKLDSNSLFCSHCGVRQESTKEIQLNNTLKEKLEDDTNLNFQEPTKQIEVSNNTLTLNTDLEFKKEVKATIVGILMLLCSLFYWFFRPFRIANDEILIRAIASTFFALIRIISILWVVNITKRQNRKSFLWGVFAFFLPEIALIIVGQLDKKSIQKQVNSNEKYDLLNANVINVGQDSVFKESEPTEDFDLFNGKHYTTKINFGDGLSGEIYLGGKSKKYFLQYGLNGIQYFENKQSCIEYLHKQLKRSVAL